MYEKRLREQQDRTLYPSLQCKKYNIEIVVLYLSNVGLFPRPNNIWFIRVKIGTIVHYFKFFIQSGTPGNMNMLSAKASLIIR